LLKYFGNCAQVLSSYSKKSKQVHLKCHEILRSISPPLATCRKKIEKKIKQVLLKWKDYTPVKLPTSFYQFKKYHWEEKIELVHLKKTRRNFRSTCSHLAAEPVLNCLYFKELKGIVSWNIMTFWWFRCITRDFLIIC
jgi:hypothetical protein